MTHGERIGIERELRNDFDRAHENSDISVTCRGCFSRDKFFFFFYNSRIYLEEQYIENPFLYRLKKRKYYNLYPEARVSRVKLTRGKNRKFTDHH